MVNRDLGRASGDPCTSTAELQREATVHYTSHENYIANMANQPFDLTIFGFNYISACIHRNYILNLGDTTVPSVSAENVADCQKECQKEDYCEVFFYYPRRVSVNLIKTGVLMYSSLPNST